MPGCSLRGDAERNGVRDFDLPAHEAARYRSPAARLQHPVELLAGGGGDRSESRGRRQAADRPADVPEAAGDRDTLDPPPPQRFVVVHEADDALAGRLPELAQEAATAASRADDEHSALVSPSDERGEASGKGALPEARDPDQERTEQHVDEVDAAREAVEGDGGPREEERGRLREHTGREHACGVARAG